MSTIRCPHCGVVNLSKFVTYPFCAGCGNRLPLPPPLAFWRRSVGPQAWAFLLCGCALCVLASVALLVSPEEMGQLTVSGDDSLYARAGEEVSLQLQVKQQGEEGAPNETVLNDLILRIPTKNKDKLGLLSVQPRPNLQYPDGTAYCYLYREFSPVNPIVLTMRPRTTGDLRLFTLLSANRQTSAGFRATVHVQPQSVKIPGTTNAPLKY